MYRVIFFLVLTTLLTEWTWASRVPEKARAANACQLALAGKLQGSSASFISELFTAKHFEKSRELSADFTKTNETNSNYRALIRNVRSVSKEVEDIAKIRPRLVFYVAAGYDASTPLYLFPEAQFIVSVDNGPFYTDVDPTFKAIVGEQSQGAYLETEKIAHITSLAPMIVGRLRAIPKVRIRKIIEISEEDQSQKMHYARMARPSHGVVEFDKGDGTPIQYYIHIQDAFSDSQKDRNSWWQSQLFAEGIDAMIVKAAQLTTDFAPESLDRVIRQIQNRNGTIVEDSGLTSVLKDSLFGQNSSNQKLTDVPFGVGFARVIYFPIETRPE